MIRAFAGILDTKLEEKFQPITRRLDTLEKRIDALEGIQNPTDLEYSEQDLTEKPESITVPKPATTLSDSIYTTKPKDLGFFDPEHDDPNKDPILTVGRYLLYFDIYTFTDTYKDLASNKPYTKISVKTAIPYYLRGLAKI